MKYIHLILAFVFVVTRVQSFAQEDYAGSGRAIQFDGIDDYVDLGNIYDDLALPVTISVWVKLNEAAVYAFPVFNSQDNLPLYNGITFLVQPQNISIQYGDGRGENNPAFRRGKAAAISDISGRWVNVSAVMRGASDIDLFLNGVNMGGFYDGSSTLPMDSDSPGDDAKIGHWLSNGITTHFRGIMDEMRIFDRPLTAIEIREQMCKRLVGNEPGLIGYWTFDEIDGNTVTDKASNHFDGILFGNPERVFSGAPVGDESVFIYPENWTGTSLSKDELTVSNIVGDPYGVHIYRVNHLPSQTGGLDISMLLPPYYGVFLAGEDGNSFFDFSFESGGCEYFKRKDNTEGEWSPLQDFLAIQERIEVIPSSAMDVSDLNVDLGSDVVLCDQNSFVLEADSDPEGKTFKWNNGQASPSITVTLSGQYSVEVRSACRLDRDTVEISFLQSPPDFSLGEDESLCTMEPRMLTTELGSHEFELTWQDGSDQESFLATDFGVYWLSVQNACGSSTDEITFIQKEEPDLEVNLGEDITLCQNLPFPLSAHADQEGKTFKWNTGETTQEINVKSTGIYSVEVRGDCKIDRDTIQVTFSAPPRPFSFGEDQILCVLPVGHKLSIDVDENDFQFTWQNGSREPSAQVDAFGTYWLILENACGSFSDSITFTKKVVTDLEFYNFISPDNGDHLNQHFVLDKKVTGSHLTVFNRWGKRVYESFSYENDWDGGGLPAGVYFYTLVNECIDPMKGTVTIMR